MKKLILLLTFAFFSTPGITQLLYYSENIEVQNITPDQAIQKSKKWAATNFSNFREALQFEDENTLILEGSVRSTIPILSGPMAGQVHYYIYKTVITAGQDNIKVELKDFAKIMGRESHPTSDRNSAVKALDDARIGKKMKQGLIDDINREYDNLDETAEWIFNGIVDALNN